MLAILNKEIRSFFSSLTGYLVIGIFLVACALFLFVFNGSYNILDSGFANLQPFFDLAPWIFIFLIPAISMRSFAEEKRLGTLEILLTKPISHWKLIMGKYLGVLYLVKLAIIPTFLYVFTISELGRPVGNFDLGSTIGSYAGLVLLGACYSSMGIFASSLTSNQVVAFLVGVFLCFVTYFGFEGLSETGIAGASGYLIESFGISYHYQSISRGVIDSRDILYFLCFIFLFLKLTQIKLRSQNSSRA